LVRYNSRAGARVWRRRLRTDGKGIDGVEELNKKYHDTFDRDGKR
jgi:hypothetical protein